MAKLIGTDRQGNQLLRWWSEGDKVYYTREDLDREQILLMNQQARGKLKASDGMRWALSIPPDDLAQLKLLYPDLGSVDRDIKHKAWQKFMKNSASEPYRVYEPSRRGATA